MPAPALAQFAGNVALSSSDVFRGESISGDDPALSVAASYDHESGLFAGGGLTVAGGKHDLRLTSANQYVGYAIRVRETSFEVGMVHRDYGRMTDLAYRRHYVEGFIGVSRPAFRVRAYVSPDYLKDGRTTYYAEANFRIATIKKWSLNGHGGLSLIPHDIGSPKHRLRAFEDWSLKLNRQFGSYGASFGIARTNYPVFSNGRKAKLVVTVSRAF